MDVSNNLYLGRSHGRIYACFFHLDSSLCLQLPSSCVKLIGGCDTTCNPCDEWNGRTTYSTTSLELRPDKELATERKVRMCLIRRVNEGWTYVENNN
jgi:hypothetical protein